MPDQAIEYVHVRDKDTGAEKFIPAAKYEAQKDLWAKVSRKSVTTDAAPTVETSAPTESGTKSGQKAATEKENS